MVSSIASAQTWWDSAWKYRTPINVMENSGSNLQDYPVEFVLDLSDQISQKKISPTLKDLRFSYYNSETNREIEIPYWIENPEKYVAASGFAGWQSQTNSYFEYYNPSNGYSYGIGSSFSVTNYGGSVTISSTTIGEDWSAFFAPGAYGRIYSDVSSYGNLIIFDVRAGSYPSCTSNTWEAKILIGGQPLWKEDLCKLLSTTHVEIVNSQYTSTSMEFKLEPTKLGSGQSVSVSWSGFGIFKSDPNAFKDLRVWTKIPYMKASAVTPVNMYYGNPSQTISGKSSVSSVFPLKVYDSMNFYGAGSVMDMATDANGYVISANIGSDLSIHKIRLMPGTYASTLLWTKSYSLTGGTPKVATDSQNNILFTYGADLTKLDASGNLVWKKTSDANNGVAVDSQNNVLTVTGTKKIIKYASDGSKTWEKVIPFAASTVRTDSLNNIVVAAGQTISKYDDKGKLIWSKTLNSSIQGDIAVDSKNNIITAAYPYLIKLDSTGKEAWSSKPGWSYYSEGYNYRNYFADLTVDQVDHVTLAGYYVYSAVYGTRYAWFANKYTSNGKTVWGGSFGTGYSPNWGLYIEPSGNAVAATTGSSAVGGNLNNQAKVWGAMVVTDNIARPRIVEFYDVHHVKQPPTYEIVNVGGSTSSEETMSITLTPGQTEFEISSMKLNLIEGEALNLTVGMDYTTVAWDVWYPTDIGVKCYLNCKNPGTNIDVNCASSKSCSYEGDVGRRSCTINGPIYSVPPSNNMTCKFYDLAKPQLSYMPYPNRTFNFIFFRPEIAGGTATIGNEFILPVRILDLGLYPDSYKVKTTATTNPEYVIVNMPEINSEITNYKETAIINDKLRFIYAGNMKLEILTRSNTMPTVNYPSSCSGDSQCEYLGAGSKCISNLCWARTEVDIASKYASLPEYGLFGLIIILISSVAIAFRKF